MVEVLVSLLGMAMLVWCLAPDPCKAMQQPDNEEYGPEVDNQPMGEDL